MVRVGVGRDPRGGWFAVGWRVKAAYLKPGTSILVGDPYRGPRERAVVRDVEYTHKDGVCVRLRGRKPLHLRWDEEVEVVES